MLKRFLPLALCLCLTIGAASSVIAAESDGISSESDAAASETDGIQVIVNDAVVQMDAPVQLVGGTSYVSYWPVVKALYPDATAAWQDGQAVVNATGLAMTVQPGRKYVEVNGRYLYMKGGTKLDNGIILVPSRILGAALGADVAWDPVGGDVVFTAGTGPIASGDETYSSDDVYWLAHIINAESGNQPLEGKIAVGNVVLNRVASSKFPDTIYDVIFQRNQFTPASSGTIYNTPNAESVIAAKLCLDGAHTAGNALYFINPKVSRNSWAARHCSYVTTIGAHAFYA